MHVNRKTLKRYGISIVLVFGLLTSFGFIDRYFEIAKSLDTFTTLFRHLNNHYVREVNPTMLMREGINAMLTSLDPYTEFIPESDIEDFRMNYVSKQYAGIGASVFNREGKAIVSEVYEGFAAQRADIRVGDEIIGINGLNITAKNSAYSTDLLKGQSGSGIKLLIRREGESQPLAKKLSREVISFKNVTYFGLLNDTTGYIKIDKFLEGAAREVKVALITLKEKHHIQSLILDLRGNGGGIVQESVNIVNLFVDKGQKVATQKGRFKEHNITYKAELLPVDNRIPLVVLVDNSSASASEIVAGAIQDLDRGTIIGQRTYGKGLVQQTLNLPFKALLKLTVAKYYTPSGRCIQAFDYSHKDIDGTSSKISDSLVAEYKTKHGRSVYDGSGIYPDVSTPELNSSHVAEYLAENLFVFDFATQYRQRHPVLKGAKAFKLSDAEYETFLKFLTSKNYNFATKEEKKLQELKKVILQEKSYDNIKAEFVALEQKLQEAKNASLVQHKQEIKVLLESEIVARYYFQTGRLEASFKTDLAIKEANRVLRDASLYATILKGEGSYKIIGKPVAYVKTDVNLPVSN
ncbi:S41 family peptidase [Adhaeribacter aquaticus]|uniref:S41 family peptidase n=1 Tax=Adhaeribacter aquaticus TaxID=299567 RepID=UPI00047C50AE|nr:S41 family peptidase [Adhaeribacter aquaticus]